MRGKVRVPEIPRRGEGVARARNKIEFRKGGEGWLDASKRSCYCAISLCLSRDHIALQGSPRKMAFEILREWWNCVSQRETGTGANKGEKGKGIWKMLDTPQRHTSNGRVSLKFPPSRQRRISSALVVRYFPRRKFDFSGNRRG